MKVEEIKDLIQAVSESSLTAFEYEENGVLLCFEKEEKEVIVQQANVQSPAKTPETAKTAETAVQAETPVQEGSIVASPLVGTFYNAPSEDAQPYVAVGTTVKKGQVIAIVEAMKLMNEIESDYEGTVAEVLVANGDAVEYGQPLFRIQ